MARIPTKTGKDKKPKIQSNKFGRKPPRYKAETNASDLQFQQSQFSGKPNGGSWQKS